MLDSKIPLEAIYHFGTTFSSRHISGFQIKRITFSVALCGVMVHTLFQVIPYMRSPFPFHKMGSRFKRMLLMILLDDTDACKELGFYLCMLYTSCNGLYSLLFILLWYWKIHSGLQLICFINTVHPLWSNIIAVKAREKREFLHGFYGPLVLPILHLSGFDGNCILFKCN